MTRRISKSLHFFPLLLIVVAVAALQFFPVSAEAQQTARAKEIGQKLLCVCGCNQILTACNHVGCKYSHDMLKELDARVARGESDDLIIQDFVQEYGPTVRAEPPHTGFDRTAWIMPAVVPLVGFALVWFLVRRWRGRAMPAPAGNVPPEMLARIRHDTDRDDDV
jgi:cytochrome c-type biogenesis protein CcmH